MSATALHELSATEALAAFRARTLSPVELMAATIARAEAVEPIVNALCHRFFDAAMVAARASERRYARGGDGLGPLDGLPLVVKEEEPIAGQPWTQGSVVYRDLVASRSSVLATRVLDAGAIVHARSTASELSAAAFTHSRLWGVTRNPWSPAWSPGGSSGGSAAALAAGTATLATGSDTAGSIRLPAAFSGVVGFKPPYGRVPAEPPFNLDRYVHYGPLARTVADCRLLQDVLAGPDPSDPASLHPKLAPTADPATVAGMRIALSTDLGDWPVDADVRRNARIVGDALRAAGAIVEEVPLTLARADVLDAAAIHFAHGFGQLAAAEAAAHPDQVTAYLPAFAAWARRRAAGRTVLDGLELESALHAALAATFADYDALICPTVGAAGFVAGDDYADHGLTVDGHAVDFYLESALTLAFNVLSRCPVLAVPSGVAGNGVPTGVQVVGRPYDDGTPFAVGAAIEAARPWPVVAPLADAPQDAAGAKVGG